MANSLPFINPAQTALNTAQQSQPNHAQAVLSLANQLHPSDPMRDQMQTTGFQLAAQQQQQQQQNPADGYIVDAPDGHSYRFSDPQSAAKAKAYIQAQQFAQMPFAQKAGNFGLGILKGFGQQVQNAGDLIAKPLTEALGGQYQPNMQFNYSNPAQQAGGAVSDIATAAGTAGAGEIAAAPLIAGMGTAGALGTEAGVQGLAQGSKAFLTTPGSLQDRTTAGAEQGALAAATVPTLAGLKAITPAFKGLFSSAAPTAEDSAFNDWLGAQKNAYSAAQSAQKEYGNAATELTNHPSQPVWSLGRQQATDIANFFDNHGLDLPKSLGSEFKNLVNEGQALESKFGAPKLTGDLANKTVDLTPKQVQDMTTELNSGKNWKNPAIQSFKEDLKNQAIDAFNSADPAAKLGDQFGQLYTNYTNFSNGIKAMSDVFSPKTNPATLTSDDIQGYVNQIQKMTPTQLAYASKVIQKTLGIDLSDPLDAINSASQIKNPLLKRVAIQVIKKLPYVGGAAVIAHDIFGGH